jgi:hypothetical protein
MKQKQRKKNYYPGQLKGKYSFIVRVIINLNIQFRLDNHGINYCDTYTAQSDYCSRGWFNYFRRLKQFHESPIIKFSYNSVGYIFFLLLFSYYLLFNFNPPTDDIPSIHWTEILVIIIVSTMLIEEIRQVNSTNLYKHFSLNFF